MNNFSLSRMKHNNFYFTHFIFFLVIFNSFDLFGQSSASCSICTSPSRVYNKSDSYNGGVNNGNNNQNNADWDNGDSPGATELAQFNKVGSYSWIPNQETKIKGIVLEGNANLTLNRFGQGITPAFSIGGTSNSNKGCIIVRSGSTLTLKYISNLNFVDICVEEGGKIVFDARDSTRNDYLFNGVEINLKGPNAKVEFGEADIRVGTGGVSFSGYTGDGCTRNADNSLTFPNPLPNISADPTKTNPEDFCNFLSQAGFVILPVEWLYVIGQYNQIERIGRINWATAKEWENSHFEIERSINGISNWQIIGEVQGKGWTDSKTEYSFGDENLPIGGGNIYYRLRQVDFNLNFEYSKTVVIRVPPIMVTKGKWRVYPNPVNDVNFYITNTEREEISAIEFKVLSSQDQIRSIKVANERELTDAVKKRFDKLPKGVFIVEIQWNQKVEYLKILKN